MLKINLYRFVPFLSGLLLSDHSVEVKFPLQLCNVFLQYMLDHIECAHMVIL